MKIQGQPALLLSTLWNWIRLFFPTKNLHWRKTEVQLISLAHFPLVVEHSRISLVLSITLSRKWRLKDGVDNISEKRASSSIDIVAFVSSAFSMEKSESSLSTLSLSFGSWFSLLIVSVCTLWSMRARKLSIFSFWCCEPDLLVLEYQRLGKEGPKEFLRALFLKI